MKRTLNIADGDVGQPSDLKASGVVDPTGRFMTFSLIIVTTIECPRTIFKSYGRSSY